MEDYVWKVLKAIVGVLSDEQKLTLLKKMENDIEPEVRWLAHDLRRELSK